MPQGGGATTAPTNSDEAESGSSQLFQLIREGVSWSGNERNNLFLSSGESGTFFDASAATGFDFADDGRGMALTDWDGDGDLDVLISNRNAPQVRFLRNDAPTAGNQSLGIRLRGTGASNLDAIGARVTVELTDRPPLIRTLRAGEGFELQNSKWLHFGLGRNPKIERVTVRWPGGNREEFSGIQPGTRYHLTQGKQVAVQAAPREIDWSKKPPAVEPPELASGGRAVTASRLPVPTLPYQTLDGGSTELKPAGQKQPTLINLWASWCKPCLIELKEFSEHRAELEDAGLKVVALTLDGVAGQPGSADAAKAMMQRLGDPFPTGIATTETVEKITILHDLIFEKRSNISLPTSLLVDAEGRLVGFFEGPLTVSEVLDHVRVAKIDDSSEALTASLPFSGRWLAEPAGFRLTELGNALLKLGYFKDAGTLVQQYREAFQIDPSFASFLLKLGLEFEKAGILDQAVQHYDASLRLEPGKANSYAQLGAKFAKLGRVPDAIRVFRKSLELDGSNTDLRYNLGIFLTRQGDDAKALQEFMQVVRQKPDHVLAHANIASQMMKSKNLPAAIKHLRLALKAKPDFHAVRFQLGRLLEATGKKTEAIAEYQELLKREPKHNQAAQRLKLLQQ